MKLTFEDIAAMVGAGVMVVVAMEMMVWAITGGYVGF
jgi:hypothetical protein